MAFTDFLTTIRWSFTGKEGPAPQISKFLSHIQRLATHNIVLPNTVTAMLVLAALPRNWDGMASTILATSTTDNLTVDRIMPMIMNEWSRRSSNKEAQPTANMTRSNLNKGTPTPQWQGGGSSSGSGSSSRGHFNKRGRGGKGNNFRKPFTPNPLQQQQPQQWKGQQPGQSRGNNADRNKGSRKAAKAKKRAASTIAEPLFATPSMAMDLDIPFTESPENISPTSAEITRDKGKNKAIEYHDLDSDPLHDDYYEDALDFGDPDDIQVMSHDRYVTNDELIQDAYQDTQQDLMNKLERISNKDRKLSLILPTGPSSYNVRICGNNVSPSDSDIINDDAFAHVCKNHEYDLKCCSMCRSCPTINIDETIKQYRNQCAPENYSTSTPYACIAFGSALNNKLKSFRACTNLKQGCPCPTCHEKRTGNALLMCDSGASDHFTFDHRDFMDYEPFAKPRTVKTADATSLIQGQGTVILSHMLSNGIKSLVKLFPVLYMPSASA